MIEIDGAHEEGGGSILRLSLALSIYTKKPFRIINIRKARKKPGLNSQNLASIELARQVCNAKVVGAKRGSYELEFYPSEMVPKNIEIDIGSAGSIVLALQSVFLPCTLSGKNYTFTITGGTDVAWSPGYDYFNEVFLPLFENYARFDCRLLKRGYYPKGGGKMTLRITSLKDSLLKPLVLTNLGRLITIKGVSNASKDLESINFADEEADAATAMLSDYDTPINITRTYSESNNTGSGLLVYGVFEKEEKIFKTGIFRVSPKIQGTVSEEVITDFKKLIEQNIPVDEFFADQLVPFLAIFGGEIKTTPMDEHLSKHMLSNIHVTSLFVDKKIYFTNDGFISCK